eukprot:scaffold65064_cov68-Phaeocystis_antarctica.AAC.8
MELTVCVHPEGAAPAIMEFHPSPHLGTCVLFYLAVYELQRGFAEKAARAKGSHVFLEEQPTALQRRSTQDRETTVGVVVDVRIVNRCDCAQVHGQATTVAAKAGLAGWAKLHSASKDLEHINLKNAGSDCQAACTHP